MNPEDDQAWEFYPETLLSFPTIPLEIDLRKNLPQESAATLAGLFDGSSTFHVLTADNPYGKELDQDSNNALRQQLKDRLEELELPYLDCDGLSPDRQHVERGYTFVCSLSQARDLAERFRQTAFFHFAGQFFSLYTPRDEHRPLRLPSK